MKIFFAQADFGGCGFYRILQTAAFLKVVCQHEVKVGFRFNLQDLLGYDLIILQRQFDAKIRDFLPILQNLEKKVIYELDDDIWNVPAENYSKSYWSDDKVKGAESVIHACDAVTTSTEPLAELIRKHNKNVYVIPNYINEVSPIAKFDTPIRVGWSGSDSHKIDFNTEILDALTDIKKKYKNAVELVFCGWIPEALIGQVSFYEAVPPMEYLYFLNELRLHIGIMPCADIPFNQSKSNLKFLEYSITKTASIASSIHPYRETITEDKGILIENNTYDEWFNAIDKLVKDTQLRNLMANNSYEFVRNNYLIMNKILTIEKLYREILAS